MQREPKAALTLVPMVVDALEIPVIAAGGIADGRGIVAALSLGAIGVQVGTVLLASNECPIHENYKQAVVKAKDNQTMVTGRTGGAPVRVIKNQMAREYVKLEYQQVATEELEKLTLGSLRRAVLDGDTKTGSLMAGQVCGLVQEVKPVAQILDDMMAEAKQELSKLNNIQL